jgi:hypothetical protein
MVDVDYVQPSSVTFLTDGVPCRERPKRNNEAMDQRADLVQPVVSNRLFCDR